MSKVSIKGNPSGTGNFSIEAPNSNVDRTLNLPDEAGTVLTSSSSITQNNGPAFDAYHLSSISTFIGASVFTKIPFQSKEFDTDDCFDNVTNYRFTPTVAGYYQLNAVVAVSDVNSDFFLSTIYKNGSRFRDGCNFPTTSEAGPVSNVSSLVYANGTTDYFEIYVIIEASTNVDVGGAESGGYFNGSLVRSE